jgi:hypothetical protein
MIIQACYPYLNHFECSNGSSQIGMEGGAGVETGYPTESNKGCFVSEMRYLDEIVDMRGLGRSCRPAVCG